MAYTEINFKTKKALKEAVKNGEKIRVYQPGPFGSKVHDGMVVLEGPHYPQPHRWQAQVTVKDHIIVEVK